MHEVVTHNLSLMPMAIVVLIILGGVFLLAGGIHLLGPLLHHFGLVLLGLLAIGALIFVMRLGLSSTNVKHVAVIDSSGDNVMVSSTGVAHSDVAWIGILKLGLIGALV